LFRDGWDGGVSNGDGIERAEVVDDVEGTSILFDDAKPSGAVSGVGWFIRTRRYLSRIILTSSSWRPSRMGIFL
jgi:hypothetical protein